MIDYVVNMLKQYNVCYGCFWVSIIYIKCTNFLGPTYLLLDDEKNNRGRKKGQKWALGHHTLAYMAKGVERKG